MIELHPIVHVQPYSEKDKELLIILSYTPSPRANNAYLRRCYKKLTYALLVP